MSLFGHLSTWLLIGLAWITLSLIASIAFGLIARVGGGEDEGK
jgi:flagellar biosynthesis protein FliR